MKPCLIDSGFLYALIDETDEHSARVSEAIDPLYEPIYLPAPAITETAYFVQKNLGQDGLAKFVTSLRQMEMTIVSPDGQDLDRAGEILNEYLDQDIDFVDAIIMSMAERLNITKILTIDHRHFSLFRPKHCNAFEILP